MRLRWALPAGGVILLAAAAVGARVSARALESPVAAAAPIADFKPSHTVSAPWRLWLGV